MSIWLEKRTVEVQGEIIKDLRKENGKLLEENECFEGMKSGIEIRIACLVEAGKEDRKSIDELVEENERLCEALVDIRDSRHCDYSANEGGSYGTGVTDGHRYCSRIAGEALEKSEKEVGDESK